jgi:hypothetical protein
MAHQASEQNGQGGWVSRSTSLLISGGWTQSTTWGRSWSGTESLPVTWYVESLLQALRAERRRLEGEGLCTAQRLDELTAKVNATGSQPVAA